MTQPLPLTRADIEDLPGFAGVVKLPPMADKFYLLIGVEPTPPATTPPPPQLQKGAEGVDVSRWQNDAAKNTTGKPDINWKAIKESGRTFAVVRASLGATGRDPFFISNWHGAGDVGLLRGGYHFFIWSLDGKEQADNFLNALGSALGDLPMVLDLEPRAVDKDPTLPGYAPIDKARCAANITAFVARVREKTNRDCAIYTNNSALSWMIVPNDRVALARAPLWIASYPRIPTNPPAPTPPWSSILCWQYSGSGTIPGVAGPIDLDRWIGE